MVLIEAVPNFSSGPGWAHSTERVLDVSADADHNRTVLTLAGPPAALSEELFGHIARAVETLDLRTHRGVHPRVGVADVVPFVPLSSDASLPDCAALARAFAERVWTELRVPCYLYGAAGRWTLREIRSSSPPPPDIGGPAPHPSAGFCCVGARFFLVAYNLVLNSGSSQNARSLAAWLRASNPSGLPGVQALAFPLSSGRQQLSLNLVAPSARPASVRLEVESRAAVLEDEVVGLCPAVWAFQSEAAAGKVLEGRLAAAALRRAAGLIPGDPIAPRFSARAAEIAELGVDPDAWLAAAEEAAAARRLLARLGVADAEVDEMLLCASARLLGAALEHGDAARRFPERVRALQPGAAPLDS